MTEPTRARLLRMALPWWDGTVHEARDTGTLPGLPAMSWLEARARSVGAAAGAWREWLLAGEGLGEPVEAHFPAGPCLAALAGEARAGGELWAIARPVHLATAIDHLRLAPLQSIVLATDEAGQLRESLNAHLAGTGFELRAATSAEWCLQSSDAIECVTFDPALAVGRNVRDYLPTGRDGRSLRGLMNEMQMVLHEHPVNERRTREGRLTVNALWIWGLGMSNVPKPRHLAPIATDDGWLAGLWALHGERAAAVPASKAAIGTPLVGLATPPAGSASDALMQVDAMILETLREELASGNRRTGEIHTGERVIVLDRWSRWRGWRRARAKPAEFA